MRYGAPSNGFGRTPMPNLALVAALEREIALLVKNWTRTTRDCQGHTFTFFERDETVLVCGGIGLEAARRASEAVIALYRPTLLYSVGFAGALDHLEGCSLDWDDADAG